MNRTHNSSGEIYVYNAHGDTVQLVKNNAVVVSYTYDAFGNLISQIGESDNPFKYCSEYFDSETQTYYLRARYYNPANGRFTQQDAWAFMDISDPLSLNLYTYCGNNPILYVDPSGNSFLAALAISAIAGAVIGFATDVGAQLINNGGNLKSINWRSAGASAVAGATGGALMVAFAPAATSIGSAMVVGGAIGGAEYATYNVVNGSSMTVEGMAVSMGYGAATAGIGYGATQPKNGLISSDAVSGSYTPSYGDELEISAEKMYQLGDHFNKHGREMGYASKAEYEQAARAFINQNKATAQIYEGKWTSNSGNQKQQIQILIRADGKQAVINKGTGQIIDFYNYNGSSGHVDVVRVQ